MPLSGHLGQLRRFCLRRRIDVTRISGPGLIGAGVQLPDGTCVFQWAPPASSIVIHRSAADVIAIHGHNGNTVLEWLDPEPPNA